MGPAGGGAWEPLAQRRGGLPAGPPRAAALVAVAALGALALRAARWGPDAAAGAAPRGSAESLGLREAGQEASEEEGTQARAHLRSGGGQGAVCRRAEAHNRSESGLMCFLVMQSSTDELPLVQNQLRTGAGIFACDAFVVFSDKIMQIGEYGILPTALMTTIIPGISLQAPAGTLSHIINSRIFLHAWQLLSEEVCFNETDWSVKVDPDTVFMPRRLRPRLPKGWGSSEPAGIYMRNCEVAAPTDLGFYGAVEVLSRRAVLAMLAGLDECKVNLAVNGLNYLAFGEDLFTQMCLDYVSAARRYDPGLLSDALCGSRPSADCSSGAVALHPFKTVDQQVDCIHQAALAESAPPPPWVAEGLRGSAGRGALRVLLGRASPALLRAAWCAWQLSAWPHAGCARAGGGLAAPHTLNHGRLIFAGYHGVEAREILVHCAAAVLGGGGVAGLAVVAVAAGAQRTLDEALEGRLWAFYKFNYTYEFTGALAAVRRILAAISAITVAPCPYEADVARGQTALPLVVALPARQPSDQNDSPEVRGQRQRRQAAGRLAAALRRAHGAAAGGTLRCWLAGALRGSLQAAARSAERAGRGATVGAGARASVLGAVARAIGVRGGGGEPATARKQRARARAGPLVDSALVWACSRLSVYSSRWVLGICFWALRSLSAGGRLQEARAEQARLKAGLASGLRHQRGLEGELEAARAEAQRLRLQSGATKDRLRNLVDLQDRTAAAEPAREESSVITIVTTTGRARGPPGPRALKGL
ncbi:unnamed protein product [Prorocentrum cordatum]|uniref:Hexosyltransferase n=1 Tax=Prorocentrum cordatum TaxID=2364126 RepID=A0ABN9V3B8_9DINO|nr:unnamed protein product [Polarella glacialis]